MEFDGGHLQSLKADLTMSYTSRGKERNLKNLITCFALEEFVLIISHWYLQEASQSTLSTKSTHKPFFSGVIPTTVLFVLYATKLKTLFSSY